MSKRDKKPVGRPRLKDKVQALTIYVKKSTIDKAGGADFCRAWLKKQIDRACIDLIFWKE